MIIPPMKFTEQQLRRLIASDNGRTVVLVILETIRQGQKVVIVMKSGGTLTLSDVGKAQLVLSRGFGCDTCAPIARSSNHSAP